MIDKIDLNEVRRRIIKAIYRTYAGEHFFVLKGGTALDIIHSSGLGRTSIDIDLSVNTEITDREIERFKIELSSHLKRIFSDLNLMPYDLNIEKRPTENTLRKLEVVPAFWKGYIVTVKFRDSVEYEKNLADKSKDPSKGVMILQNEEGDGKFSIDLSGCEFVPDELTVLKEIDGVTVICYSLELIALEKIRAICQQLKSYPYNNGRRKPRPKDFFDITNIYEEIGESFINSKNYTFLIKCMEAKGVNLEALNDMFSKENYAFNKEAFDTQLIETIPAHIKNDVILKGFIYYFNKVKEIVQKLKSLG